MPEGAAPAPPTAVVDSTGAGDACAAGGAMRGHWTVTAPLWADEESVHDAPAPPLPGDTEADVCVVGLGAAGLSAVLALRARGASVVAVDAAAPGGGASGRNGGFLLAGLAAFHHDAVARHGRRRAADLYRLTLDEIEHAAESTGPALRRVGSIRLASSAEEQADCDEQLRAMRADGLPVEVYDGPLGRGLRFPADASLQPMRRCALLAQHAVAAGAVLHSFTVARDVRGDQVVTDRGAVRCRRVIVAVDGGMEALLPELAGRLRTARAQMLATEPDPRLEPTPPLYARWGWDYWQVEPGGRVALGGFRDAGGDAEWGAPAVPSVGVQQVLEACLRRQVPTAAAVTHRWAGRIAYSNDGLPILAEARPGVVVAGAYSGTGNALGPLCGRAAVDLALDGRSPVADLLRA